jgi:transcription elongation factor GreA
VRKETGIANPTLAEVKAPEPKPVTRIVTFPTGEADGARDEAKRPRRPAPGRGVGRVASAAGYAAQGSPRKPPPEPVLVSAEGLERLQAELAELLAERPGVIKRIATAREHGDLKENAEYHAAREEQGFLEGRIKAIEAKLKVAVVVAPTERGATVGLGARVRVMVDGEETVMQVVSSAEANSREGRISSSSPVGAALMGRKVGDEVTIITPGGELHYEVLEIS